MTALALALGLGLSGWAQAGQTGGQVVAGSGSIAQDGAVTTITQTSQQLSLNWQSFNIDAGETVNFIQPGASSIAVNRVLGNSASEIFGKLNANGQVWLINPNGVLFGKNAQVDVGGIVASTLDTSDTSLFSATRRFNGDGHGSVVNRGRITAHGGGYVALLGHQVSNQGSISARLGTVAMGAGSAITLTFEGNQLLHLQVDRSTLDDLVENRQLIQADGGRVMLTAGAAESLLASSVNNTGVVRAQTVDNRHGEITLLAGATAGTTHVAGTLDASAPVRGDGGFIETSAAQVDVAGDAHINASAAQGASGQWLLDPTDLNIDAALAGSMASTLNGGTNVTQQTTSAGSGGVGDINVNAAINWTNAAAALTLDAYHSVNVNAPINGAGSVLMKAGADIKLAAAVAGSTGVTLQAAGNFINTAGAGALSASAGKWLVYSTNPTASSTGGLAADFIQYDMTGAGTPTAIGNGFVYSVAPTVNFTGLTGTVTKDYDGTNAATLTDSNFTSTGLLSGDKLISAKGTYASVNAGTGIAVTALTAATDFTFADAGGTLIYGYKVGGLPLTANIGTIDPKALTVSIIGTPTKVYNATTTAMLVAGNYAVDGVVAGEGVNFSQPSAVSYDSADAGARTVTATFLPSNFVAAPGTYLANYILPTTATGAGQINQAPLELSGLLAQDKTYDGNSTATLDKGGASIFGVVAADTGLVGLDTSAGTGTFASANAGTWNVTTSGFTLTGTKAANYVLNVPTNLSATINRKALDVSSVTALDKVYDATTTASLDVASAALGAGVLAGDDVTLSTTGATGAFGSANVGTGLGVTVNGFALAGTAANNYSLAQPTGLSADITPAPLTITVTGNPTRTYNGTSLALVGESDFTISGWQGSDNGKITQNAGASYASPDASASNPVTVLLEAPDFVMSSGSLSNYAFASAVFGNGTISPITLTYALVGNPTKTYDGTTDATLVPGNYKLDGFLAGQGATVTQTHGTYADPNVGQWLVTANLTAADFSLFGGAKLVNYVWPTLVTGAGTIKPATLGGGLIDVSIDGPTKLYDGTTDATLTPANFILTGFAAGEGASVNQTVGIFADKNVGMQAVSATLAPGNFDANPGTNLGNYTLPTMAYGTGEITPVTLTASIIGTPTKVYDGGTYVVLGLANYKLDGFVGAEGADINPPSAVDFDDKNVGTPNITATLTPSSYVAHAGTLLSNYILADTATGAGMITPAPLYVNGVSATSRVYDTTNIAQLTGTGKLVGLVLADVGKVTLTSGTTGTFAQADVGNGIGVTANGFSISGTESGNYTLLPLAGLTANITPYHLSINGVTADDREYDGSTDITLDNSAASLFGVFGTDTADVTLGTVGALGHTRSANVGTDLAVSTSGFTLSGAKAHNYIVDQVGGLKASITPKVLTGTIIGDPTKPYDGTGSVTLTATDFNLVGVVAGESISVPQTSNASYNDVNAGSNRGLTAHLVVSDFLATPGTSLANYVLPTDVYGTLGTITQAVISLQGTRVYNALTDANASLFTSGGTIDGVDGEKLTLTGSGILTTKNVGSRQPFADFSGFTLGASGASNPANYTLVGGTHWVTITPALLHVGGLGADDKTYDGNRTATLNGTATGDQFAGDVITFGNTATGLFDTKNAGTGKSVATAVTLGGADAGNYTVVQQTGITADISRKTITVDATGKNKTYDGTITSGATLSSAGKVSGDALGYSSTSNVFADKNVANGIAVTVSGIGLTGADAGNYTLASTTATTTANITPHILNLSGTRVYNALTDADADLFGNKDGTINGVSGETLTLTGSGLLGDKNVGTNKAFTPGTLALGNGTGGGVFTNYAFGTYKLTVTKANLTVSGTVAANKTYDGNRNAALSGATLDGVLLTDAVTLGNTDLGTFDTKDVGTNKPVTTAFTISGTDAGNYNILQPAGITADITKLAISVVVTATGKDKVYDGTTHSDATLDSADFVTGDDVSLTNTFNEFVSKDVGSNILVNISGISLAGDDAGNYSLTGTTATTHANITPYVINLQGTRVYDATTGANYTLFGNHDGTIDGIAGEKLALSGSGTLADKNVGTEKAVTSFAGLTLGDDGTSLASNYTFTGGTHWVTVTPYALTVTATADNKIYDRLTAASTTLTSSPLLGGDVVTFNPGAANFSDKNVANGKTVTVTGITSTGDPLGNYTFNTTATTTADITPLAITGAITADNKVYNAGVDATTAGTLTGVLGGDVLTFGTTGAFSDKNVANGKTVTVSGSLSGADAGNYTLTTNGTTTANITPLAVTVSATADDKVYDGNDSAVTTLAGGGVLAGDTVVFSAASATFSDKNVANGKTVSVHNIVAIGADAGNYTVNTSTTTTADITPLAITGAITASNKIYDAGIGATTTGTLTGVLGSDTVTFGTTGTFGDKNVAEGKTVTVNGSLGGVDAGNYTLTTNATTTADITPLAITGSILADNKVYDAGVDATTTGTLTGVLGGDVLTFGTTGTFSDKNVANGKTVTVTGSLGGADAGNYTVTSNTTTLANITPLAITGSILADNKVYDATTAATVHGTLTGVLSGDVLTVGTVGGTFGDKDAGIGKTVNVTGAVAGADQGNYTVTFNPTTTADITRAIINLSGTRVYNGDATADASMFGTAGIVDTGVAGEQLELIGSGTLVDKNVSSSRALNSLGTLALADHGVFLAGNYTLAGGTHVAAVTPLAITGTITADGKIYDGGTVATIHGSFTGAFAGDDLGLSSTGSFADKNAGTDKLVNVSGSLTGADAGNYTLTSNTTTLADITPLAITGSILADNKVYDATTAATVHGTLTGVLGGDVLVMGTVGGTFGDKDAGIGKTVNVTGTVAGADQGNYTVTFNPTTTADITRAIINLSGTRVYNSNATADAGMFGTAGIVDTGVAGEQLGLIGSGLLVDKNVSPSRALNSLGTLALTDHGVSLAKNYTLAGGAHVAAVTPFAIIGTITADGKVYDGGTVATIHGSFTGAFAGDDLGLSSTGSFADKNAGIGKLVDVSGSLTGTDAGNYTLMSNTTTLANITPLAITGSILADNKVYDATTAATVHGTLTGVLGGDVLTFDTSGTFSDKNVADGKTVTVTGSLTGTDAGNYTLTSNTTTLANITPLAITGSILADNKVYDATTAATVHGTLAGVLGGDVLSFDTSGVFSDKNVADGKTVTVTGSLGGTDAGNYTLTSNTTTTANITPLAITGDILADDKVYDGTTVATIHGTLTGTVLAGDDLGLGALGSFADKNAGTDKLVNVSSSLTGADAGNYTLIANTTTMANITPLAIDVLATGVDKFFDGSRQAEASLTGQGVLAGDAVVFDSTSKWFDDPAPGNGKTITVSDIFATGADAGNYAFNHTATTTANILPLANQQAGSVAYTQLGWLLRTRDLATPYGVGPAGAANPFAGNQKGWRQPVEANTMLPDFYSGLALRVVDGGVAAPRDAM